MPKQHKQRRALIERSQLTILRIQRKHARIQLLPRQRRLPRIQHIRYIPHRQRQRDRPTLQAAPNQIAARLTGQPVHINNVRADRVELWLGRNDYSEASGDFSLLFGLVSPFGFPPVALEDFPIRRSAFSFASREMRDASAMSHSTSS